MKFRNMSCVYNMGTTDTFKRLGYDPGGYSGINVRGGGGGVRRIFLGLKFSKKLRVFFGVQISARLIVLTQFKPKFPQDPKA